MTAADGTGKGIWNIDISKDSYGYGLWYLFAACYNYLYWDKSRVKISR